MADVTKRLEEIEHFETAHPDSFRSVRAGNTAFLLRLTRALLESQGELIEEVRGHACCRAPHNPCSACNAIARAERTRKGEV